MATYFLDPIGGNDANSGVNFTNRKKTPSGFSSLAAGDTIRVIASKETDLGNCTWTDNTLTVTMPAAMNATVDNCDSGWTGVTNSTVTHASSDSLSHVEGTGYVNISVASGFTTGKCAYKNLGSTLDLSAYTMLSFIITSTTAQASGRFRFDLCSDTVGDVPVVSFTQDLDLAASARLGFLFDAGTALPSNVNSISIVALVDPGTVQIRIDNIVACKSLTSGQHLSHICAVRKNTADNEAFAIRSISGTTITLGNATHSVGSPGRNWRGTTETVSTEAVVPLYLNPTTFTTTLSTFPNASGTPSSKITVSGGWNSVDMGSQTGETWVCRGINSGGFAFGLYGATLAGVSNWHFENLGFCGLSTRAIYVTNTYSTQISVNLIGSTNCGELLTYGDGGGSVFLGPINYSSVEVGYITLPRTAVLSPRYEDDGRRAGGKHLYVRCNRVTMSSLTTAVICGNQTVGTVYSSEDFDTFDVVINRIDNCQLGIGAQYCLYGLRDCVFSNNTSDLSMPDLGYLWMDNCDVTVSSSTTLPVYGAGGVFLTNRDGVIGDHDLHLPGKFVSTNSGTHGVNPYCWVLNISGSDSFPHSDNTFCVSQIAVKSGEIVTVSAWVYSIGASSPRVYGIRSRAVPSAGVVEQIAQGTDVNQSWNQISVTFTATRDCVVPVDVWLKTGAVRVDDITVEVA